MIVELKLRPEYILLKLRHIDISYIANELSLIVAQQNLAGISLIKR